MRITYIFPRMGYGAGITNILTEIKYIKTLNLNFTFQLIAVEKINIPELSLKAFSLGVKVRLAPSDSQLKTILENTDLAVFHYWNCPSSYVFIKRLQLLSLPMRLCLSIRTNGFTYPQIPPTWVFDMAVGIIKVHPKTPVKHAGEKPVIQIPSIIEVMESRKELSFPNFNRFKLIYAGAFNPCKTHPQFLEIHQNLPIKNYQLDVYGNINPTLFPTNSNIHLKGFSNNLQEIIGSYHMLSNLQHRMAYSSFDKIMKECQWVGVPPIVIKGSSVGDLIQHNVDGIVANDLEDYVENLAEISKNESRYLALRSSTFDCTHASYKPLEIIEKTIDFYALLVQTNSKNAIHSNVPERPLQACIDGLGEGKSALEISLNNFTKEELWFLLHCEGGLAQFSHYFEEDLSLKELIATIQTCLLEQ